MYRKSWRAAIVQVPTLHVTFEPYTRVMKLNRDQRFALSEVFADIGKAVLLGVIMNPTLYPKTSLFLSLVYMCIGLFVSVGCFCVMIGFKGGKYAK
jgi:hypothetical protein